MEAQNLRIHAFGSGTSERFEFRAVEPFPFNIIAVPGTWSPSTNGRITGPAIRVDVHSQAELQRFTGKLKGAFILLDPPRETPAHFEPQAERMTDDLLEMLATGQRLPTILFGIHEHRYDILKDPAARRWLVNERVAALLFTAPGDGGTIAQAGPGSGGFPNKNTPDQLPIVKVSAESYGRIVRILEKDLLLNLELNMQNTFYDQPNLFNVIAEIPGTDPKLMDEVVMIGAHLDAWAYGTGATDNAAGAAVIMEAMRILKKLKLHPRRTIRCALWTGHEQGAVGSTAYVTRHLQDISSDSSIPKPEHEKLSAYFDLDGGTGKIRCVTHRRNTPATPIFSAWIEPFKEIGLKTVGSAAADSGDGYPFEQVGLPVFRFAQDPIEFNTRTRHTNADVYERLQPDDLKFNAAVLASFAWQAAQRDEKMPRIPPRQ